MKILLVSSYLPYPLDSGGHVRLYNLIKELSQRHEITLICEKRKHQTKEDVGEVKKFCREVLTVDRQKQWSIRNILKAGFSFYPFLLVGHESRKMNKIITDELTENTFDVIHIETFYVMQNLPLVSIPTVLVEHNIEYLVYTRYSNTVSFFLKLFLLFDIAKLRYWENYYWKTATRLIAVSDAERKLMNRSDVAIVPNGVDLQKFQYKPKKPVQEKRILFLGNFKWVQNKDSIQWILKEIWPRISSQFTVHSSQEVKLWVVGRNIPESIKRLTNDPSIIYDDNAPDDTALIFQNADILLAPIRVGGGTSFKILEAMASGVPVVTTQLGAEGIQAINNKEVLVAEDTDSLAEAIVNLLSDTALYKKIALHARKHIEQHYDWINIAQKLEEVYSSAVD